MKRKQRWDMADPQLVAAYGDRYPGSHQRWVDQTDEREAIKWSYRRKQAWALYRRVHGEPCQSELDRLEYERQVKAKQQASLTGRPTIGLTSYGPEAGCEGCGDGDAA